MLPLPIISCTYNNNVSLLAKKFSKSKKPATGDPFENVQQTVKTTDKKLLKNK
jgi:hypothetical protein